MDARKIMVAVDGTEQSRKALDLACDLSKSKSADLIIAHVQREHGAPVVPAELKRYNELEHVKITEQEILQKVSNDILHAAQKQARESGVAKSEAKLCEGDPAESLVTLAADEAADVLVLGSRGVSDLDGLLFGSTSHQVEHKAGCTVIVVH